MSRDTRTHRSLSLVKSSLGTRQPAEERREEVPIAMSPVFRNPGSHVRTAWQEGSLHVALRCLQV